jgi:hypothetical protein
MRILFRLVALAIAVSPWTATAQTPPRWTLTEEFRITEDAGVEFSRLSRVVPAPGGGVLIVETMPWSLHMFDVRGRFVRTVGRVGAGPGEYESLSGAGFLKDTLWISDSRLRRVTLFATDGKVMRTVPQSPQAVPPGPGMTAAAVTLLSGDRALGSVSTVSSMIASGEVKYRPMLMMTRDGRILDTLGLSPVGNSQLAIRYGTGGMFTAQPYGDYPLNAFAADAERVYVIDRAAATSARGATFGVTALNFKGDTVWKRRYPYTPVALARATVDSFVTQLMAPQGPRPGIPEAAIREPLYVPAFRAAVSDAVAATDGSLWVRLSGTSENSQFLVIAPNGNLVGSVQVKRTVLVSAIDGDVVWMIDRDEDDVPIVVKARVRR